MTSLCRQRNVTHLATQLPTVFAAARLEQLSDAAFLTQALQTELTGRLARAQARRLRAAWLPFAARLEQFDFRFQPNLSERTIRELASLTFLTTATNGLFFGPPGVGKTHLACGLAHTAISAGHTALCVTLRELAQQFEAPAPRGGRAAVRRYSQPTRLIIDEVGYTQLSHLHAQALFDLVSARYERRSPILTSNLTFREWGGLLGDDVFATAMWDRLLHHAEVVAIHGRRYRMRQRVPADAKPTVS